MCQNRIWLYKYMEYKMILFSVWLKGVRNDLQYGMKQRKKMHKTNMGREEEWLRCRKKCAFRDSFKCKCKCFFVFFFCFLKIAWMYIFCGNGKQNKKNVAALLFHLNSIELVVLNRILIILCCFFFFLYQFNCQVVNLR